MVMAPASIFVFVATLAASQSTTDGLPLVPSVITGASGLGLLYLFWKVQRSIIREQDKRYTSLARDHKQCRADVSWLEECQETLVDSLRFAGIAIPKEIFKPRPVITADESETDQ